MTKYESEGEKGWLDFDRHKVKLYPTPPEAYVTWLKQLGCEVSPPIMLADKFILPDGRKSTTFGDPVAVLIKATKK